MAKQSEWIARLSRLTEKYPDYSVLVRIDTDCLPGDDDLCDWCPGAIRSVFVDELYDNGDDMILRCDVDELDLYEMLFDDDVDDDTAREKINNLPWSNVIVVAVSAI